MQTISEKNLPELLTAAVKKYGTRPHSRQKENGQWVTWDWNKLNAGVRAVARSFMALGLKRGDRFNIMSYTRRAFVLSDWGGVIAGGVCVTIYQSNTPAETQYIVGNSGARFLFAENEAILAKIRKIKADCPTLEKVIVFDPVKASEDWVLSWEQFLELGRSVSEEQLDKRSAEIGPEDNAGFVYTSGTTGPPKGVISSHRNWLAVTRSASEALSANDDDEVLLLLPLAHVFARLIQYTQLRTGYTVSYAESIERAVLNMQEVRPTMVPSVPRIFEKAYTKIMANAQAGGPGKLRIFQWAIAVGRQVSGRRQQGREPGGWLALKYALADKLVFRKVAANFGGRIRFFISGGAPLSKDIAEFFHAANLLILEGYGMTENTSLSHVNRITQFKFGTVGPAVPGVEVRIAADGEVLTRGANTMKGYYGLDEATREAVDSEGWLHTGDIGEIDADGFLRITDRKKDIIVNAGGKNISPQNIENLIKTDNLISQVMVHGDKRKYLSALVTLDRDEASAWCKAHGVPCDTDEQFRALASNPTLIEEIKGRIERFNADLAGYEQVKRFAVLPGDFTQESGELTPTLKLKRKVITQKYIQLLDGFYNG